MRRAIAPHYAEMPTDLSEHHSVPALLRAALLRGRVVVRRTHCRIVARHASLRCCAVAVLRAFTLRLRKSRRDPLAADGRADAADRRGRPAVSRVEGPAQQGALLRPRARMCVSGVWGVCVRVCVLHLVCACACACVHLCVCTHIMAAPPPLPRVCAAVREARRSHVRAARAFVRMHPHHGSAPAPAAAAAARALRCGRRGARACVLRSTRRSSPGSRRRARSRTNSTRSSCSATRTRASRSSRSSGTRPRSRARNARCSARSRDARRLRDARPPQRHARRAGRDP